MRRHPATPIVVLACLCFVSAPASAVPRSEIVAAAPSFEDHVWSCGPENLEAECADSSWRPAVTETGPQVGLPYNWGGWVTLDQFDRQISEGYGAGSMPAGWFIDCTTGVDCSGYVSQLWQTTYKLSTREIPDVSEEILPTEMLPGDVFNMDDIHVIMFLGEDDNGNAIVTESTTDSACMGVCRRSRPWSAFSSYVPRAYVFADMARSTQAGTVDDLIPIDSFPYRDSRSTVGAASDIFDFYSAAPETDESGPERLYFFEAVSSGTLTATVTDAVGVDIDVHLLSSLDANACLARDDTQITHEITAPGTYYLALDTYVGDSGTEYTGDYLLTADFSGLSVALDGGATEPDGGVTSPDAGSTDASADGAPEEPEEGCSCRSAGAGRIGRPLTAFLLLAGTLFFARLRRL